VSRIDINYATDINITHFNYQKYFATKLFEREHLSLATAADNSREVGSSYQDKANCLKRRNLTERRKNEHTDDVSKRDGKCAKRALVAGESQRQYQHKRKVGLTVIALL
jgi:hypothetical protein